MIPPRKLITLPRSQKLRKAAKITEEAERQCIMFGRLEPEQAEYLREVVELLAKDEGFSVAQTAALENARTILGATGASGKDIHRAVDSVYHILLAETGRYQADWDFIEAPGSLDPSKRRPFSGMCVYLEDIRSPFNVGSMFRSAESFGAEKLILSPLCADPRHKRALRTAMGCVEILPWERLPRDPFSDSPATPFSDSPCFTLETGGVPLADFQFPSRGILIAGSEELGVSPRALAVADASLGRVSVPTYGAKGSLNVSVAFGIVMQAWAAALTKHLGIYYSDNING